MWVGDQRKVNIEEQQEGFTYVLKRTVTARHGNAVSKECLTTEETEEQRVLG